MGLPEFASVRIASVTCCKKDCDALIIMPEHVMDQYRETHEWWYCYRGHSQHFPGKSDKEKLREANADLAKKLERERKLRAWADQAVEAERAQTETAKRGRAAYKGKLNRVKKRVAAGVCPCCNRQFQNLHSHMVNKHPGYGAPDNADG